MRLGRCDVNACGIARASLVPRDRNDCSVGGLVDRVGPQLPPAHGSSNSDGLGTIPQRRGRSLSADLKMPLHWNGAGSLYGASLGAT
jgi:hypothetical protein